MLLLSERQQELWRPQHIGGGCSNPSAIPSKLRAELEGSRHERAGAKAKLTSLPPPKYPGAPVRVKPSPGSWGSLQLLRMMLMTTGVYSLAQDTVQSPSTSSLSYAPTLCTRQLGLREHLEAPTKVLEEEGAASDTGADLTLEPQARHCLPLNNMPG